MRRLPVLLLFLLPLAVLFWACEDEARDDPYTSEFLEAATVVPDGGYLLAGRSVRVDNDHEDGDGYLVRLAADGTPLWERLYDLGAFGGLQAVRVRLDGGILAAGVFDASLAATPLFLLSAAADGTLNWLRAPALDSLAAPKAVKPTADGGFFVAGMTEDWGKLRLVKLDAEANVTLDRTYYELDNLLLSDAVETADGNIVLLCRLILYPQTWLIKTGAGGDTLWSQLVASEYEYGVRDLLTELPSGRLVVATALGQAAQPDAYSIRLYHTDANGVRDTSFAYVYDTERMEVPLALTALENDGVAVAGLTRFINSEAQDFKLLQLDAAGLPVIGRAYDLQAADRATFVVRTADNGLLFGGFTSAGDRPGFDGCVLKVNPSGALEWQRFIGG